ncbi:MAG TPA: phenylalanine--tRNA ligase subunit alpha [archaeon]|nr:phenylalanine--tRNA ligase subunit alpha [archaeon]
MHKLTTEGEEYLKMGLPEKRLLDFVKSKKTLAEVSQLPYTKIAIGWARKHDWIRMDGGFVEITEKGLDALRSEHEFETALKKIKSTGSADPDIEKTLLSRGLIDITKEKIPEAEEEKTGLFGRLFSRKQKKEERIEEPVKAQEAEIAQLTPEHLISGSWKGKDFKKYDPTTPVPKIYPGKKQPYLQFIEDVRQKLIGLGFQEMSGPIVETNFWNMDALFVPQDHPARGVHDVLILKNPKHGNMPDKNLVAKVKATHEGGWITGSSGWGGGWSEDVSKGLLLRSQTTAVSARTLAAVGDKPGKYFTIGRVFRHDTLDFKHLLEFDQCEGIVVGENLTLKHLLGFLKELAESLGIKEIKFKPSYYPFVEPGVDMYANFKERGWTEVAGAGLLRPEVLKPLGIEKSQVLAWGIGIGRLAMLKLGLSDIRMLYSEDLKFLRSAKV